MAYQKAHKKYRTVKKINIKEQLKTAVSVPIKKKKKSLNIWYFQNLIC